MRRYWEALAASDRFWIGAQLLLFACSGVAGIRQLRQRRPHHLGSRIALATIPAATAVVVAEKARRELGRNITIAPTPVRDGHLVDSGIYGVVRHPMYLSAILGLLAWTIATGPRVSALAVPFAVAFFSAKARHEESLLRQRYEDYDAYSRRVTGRLLPRPRRSGDTGG